MSRLQVYENVTAVEYVKEVAPIFFDEVGEGERFTLAKIQIYFDGPHDFTSIFVKDRGKAVHEQTRKAHPVSEILMVVRVSESQKP